MWLTLPSFYPVYYIDVWLIQFPYSLWVILLHDLFILKPRVFLSRVMNIKGQLCLQWISVGVWLRPPHNAAMCSLCAAPLLWAQWLSGKSIWLVFRRSWVQIPAGPRVFFLGIEFLSWQHQLSHMKSTDFLSRKISLLHDTIIRSDNRNKRNGSVLITFLYIHT